VPGVIALLPEPFAGRVESLWESMERDFAVPRGYPGAVPHISFHLGARDVEPAAAAAVSAVAGRTAPFVLYSAGLGVFAADPPVVHIAVARSPEAARLADNLTAALEAVGIPNADAHFTPQKWMPHVTIAHRNLTGVALGPLLAWLAQQPLAWEIPIGSLSLARETADSAEILATFELHGG
jgi:2'-5' RNA ligase